MSYGKRAARVMAIVCAVALVFETAAAWSDLGHTLINRVAAEKIPASMPQFLKQAVATIEYLGPEPDRWRNNTEMSLKNAQEPDHFIDMERVSDIQKFPVSRYDFYRLLYAKRVAAASHGDDFLPEKVGMQPYITMEIYGRLVVAFREYRRLQREGKPTAPAEANAIHYAGWLGHYVADGSNPMHTTVNYDGWAEKNNPNGYTTQRGFHSEFESRFVTRNYAKVSNIGDLVRDPVRLQNPFDDYISYLRESNSLVEKTYQLEKAGAFRGEGTPEGQEFVRQRLAAGAQMLLNMWYTAWEASATEPPPYRMGPSIYEKAAPAPPE